MRAADVKIEFTDEDLMASMGMPPDEDIKHPIRTDINEDRYHRDLRNYDNQKAMREQHLGHCREALTWKKDTSASSSRRTTAR